MARTLSPDALTATFDTHLTRVARHRARRGLPAPQVRITAPGLSYEFGDTLPFHAASIGKLATAALVVQQIEARRLEWTTPIDDILEPSELAGLFAAPGATIEQLLGHTSGAADYFEDRAAGTTRFLRRVIDEPNHFWEPRELFDFTRHHQRPVGLPGGRFHYSDTGYVLLGRALETVTGRSFTTLLREGVLGPAGMRASAFWQREPSPERIAPVWLGRVEASHFASVSCGWAGGGIVATPTDLEQLGAALSDGTLVSTESWARMTQPQHRVRPGIHYGLGTMQLRFDAFDPFSRGLPRPVGHLGSLATHLFIDTERGTSVVLNFHGRGEMSASFRTHIRIAQGLAKLG